MRKQYTTPSVCKRMSQISLNLNKSATSLWPKGVLVHEILEDSDRGLTNAKPQGTKMAASKLFDRP
jgi:hypothetical protein